MTVNPVLFGVLATLSVESVVANFLLIAWFVTNKNHSKTIRGGKYNG